VLVEDANHCKDSLDFHFNTPVLQVYAGLDYAIFAGESVHPEPLLNTNTPLTYSWTPEIDILGEHSLHPILTPHKSTNYTLTIQDMKGCKASDELTVTVKVLTDLPIYNAFTPNKDGNNDVFSLKMFNDKIQLEDFSIYNRYGQKIFATRSLQEGWDGTFKGEEQEIGTYIYEIRFLDANGDEHIKKGDIILMR
jgi:gliding motility-associated-like protein